MNSQIDYKGPPCTRGPLVIGVDIRVLGTGKTSGVEEYTEQLLAHMIPLYPAIGGVDIQYKLFYAGRRPLVRRPWMDAPNVQVFDTRKSNRLLWLQTRLTGRPYLDKLMGGADLFFFPHFLAGATSPECRRVLTMHDLSFERFPEFFSFGSRLWHAQMQPRAQVHAADHLIAVSESTRQDLLSLYGIAPERVTTIHSGVDPSLRRAGDDHIRRFKDEHHLPEKFILMLGARDPRKNRQALIAAAERARIPVITPDIPAHERALWLSAASVLAYPSFFEGFGFPPLEAMACGTPVMVGANSSQMELYGEAALLVDPYSISQMSHALAMLLHDDALRARLIARGTELASRLSWQRTATLTLKTFFDTMKGYGPSAG